MKKHKFKIAFLSTLLALVVGGSFFVAHASWQFNASASPMENIGVAVTNWTFDDLPVTPENTIVVNSDGSVTILDENGNPTELEAEVSYPEGETVETHGGSVSIELGVVDGEIVVTDYSATGMNSGSGIFGVRDSTIVFPASIEIEGTNYPIVSISEPVEISASNGLIRGSTCDVQIPEGYKTICDDAFQNVSASGSGWGTTTFTFNLPSTLTYLGNHAIKLNVSGGSVTVNFAGTVAQFKTLVSNSASAYGSGYSFFTASGTTRCTVNCSDSQVVYNQDGTVYSG